MGLALAAVTATPALAVWLHSGSGAGNSGSLMMPGGNTPTTTVSGRNVAVSWAQSSLENGTPASAYVVRRYDTSNVAQTVKSACTGSVSALTCAEQAVPPGAWKYTVTPKLETWNGAESSASSNAVVGSPALTLDPDSVPSTTLPRELTGTIANFIDLETLSFRLDDPTTGQVLAGTPTQVVEGGSANVTVTVPAGTSIGTHTIYAVASPSGENASDAITITGTGISPPTVIASVIGSSPNRGAGVIKPGGKYHVYANVSGTVDAATANVANVTAGATTVTLSPCTGGQCTIHGTTYGYKSAEQLSDGSLTEAANPYAYTVTASNSGGSHTANFTVNVDTTAPRPHPTIPLELLNGSSPNVAKKVEQGDLIRVTYTEALAVNTLCTGWDNNAANQSTTLTVTFHDGGQGGAPDSISVSGASCGTFHFGTIAIGHANYVKGGDVTFSSSPVTWDATNFKLTITLGTPCTNCGTSWETTGGTTAVYTPDPAIQDLAGNGITGTSSSTSNQQHF